MTGEEGTITDLGTGYRRIYRIYLGSSGLAEELKPFFRLPGIEQLDGFLQVNDEFRALIRRLADAWLRGEWPPRSA